MGFYVACVLTPDPLVLTLTSDNLKTARAHLYRTLGPNIQIVSARRYDNAREQIRAMHIERGQFQHA